MLASCLRFRFAREAQLPPRSAIHSLHRKLFLNYTDWCESMRVAPKFMPVPPPTDEYGGVDKAEVGGLGKINAEQQSYMLYMGVRQTQTVSEESSHLARTVRLSIAW